MPQSEAPGPSVRFYTLGAFRLLLACGQDGWVDLTRTRMWGHGRAQDLLLLLLLKRKPVARMEAAAILWPNSDASRRARLLRNALWNLRRALAQHAAMETADGATATALLLHESPYTVSLQVSMAQAVATSGQSDTRARLPHEPQHQIWCDVLAFEAAATQARAAQTIEDRLRLTQTALRLNGGPFLQHRQSCDAGDAWVMSYRAQAQANWMRVALDRATDLRRLGEREQSIRLLLQALDYDAAHVEAARRAMLVLGELGHVCEAVDLYERTRRAYQETHGTDPSGLKRLAMDLRAGRVVYAPEGTTARHNSGVFPRMSRAPGNGGNGDAPARAREDATRPFSRPSRLE